MAMLLQDRHILVNSLAPGFFPSRMANGLLEISGGAEQLAKSSPNGRLGRAEDIAATVVWLCSRGGSHVNGDTIVLDGGKLWDRSKL
jgi:NAD(P)-dependent dehydrogenase (short-subunit alcohol dehydrogenase family)